jgi:hypothetical protein
MKEDILDKSKMIIQEMVKEFIIIPMGIFILELFEKRNFMVKVENNII